MKKYGLIGYPLGHSFSKNFFNEKFHSENIDAEYVNFEIPSIKELPSVLLANPDLVGLMSLYLIKNKSSLIWTNWIKMRQPSEPSM